MGCTVPRKYYVESSLGARNGILRRSLEVGIVVLRFGNILVIVARGNT